MCFYLFIHRDIVIAIRHYFSSEQIALVILALNRS